MALLQIEAGKRLDKPSKTAEGLICVFHGYGADGENLYDIGLALSQVFPKKLIILPNALQRFEGGGGGYQWFSLRDYRQDAMEKELSKVAPIVNSWLKKRLAELSLPEEVLELVGFSQGVILSLYLASSNLIKPKNILAYSGLFIPPKVQSPQDKKTNLLALHGSADPVLTLDMTKKSYSLLKNYGLNHQLLIEDNLGHYISDRGIKSGLDFLSKNH